MTLNLYFLLLAAYLIGAIPTGVLLTRLAGAGDIRQSGSGNIGATNVYRVAGRGLGIATLVGDAFKGIIPLLCARALDLSPEETALIATGDAVTESVMKVLGRDYKTFTASSFLLQGQQEKMILATPKERFQQCLGMFRLSHADADAVPQAGLVEIAHENALLFQCQLQLPRIPIEHAAQNKIRLRRIRVQETE